MKTVGEVLKEARLKKGIKRTEIVKKTKINPKYLIALEEGDFDQLPEAAFVRGFIRNYANAVDLRPEQVLAIFRRDYDQNVKGKVIPRELMPKSQERKSLWNPKTTMIAGILFASLVLGTYFIYQYYLLTAPPNLEVISPKEQEQVVSTVTISGKTDNQATVTINNQQVLVNDDGDFSQTLVLPEGTRTITIEATNRSGKSRIVQRTVNVSE